MNSKLKNLFILLIIAFLTNCTSSKVFKKLKKTDEHLANFYIIRPIETTLGIWSYTVEIYKYKSHFKHDKNPKLIKKIPLDNGEYAFLRLEEGYYKLFIKGKELTDKIVYLSKNSEQFIKLYIFSPSHISKAEFYLKEIEKKEAIELLIEGNHLNESPLSSKE
ncbi:MAG: hypothetical protein KDK90_14440 [Leptospiraceae bacterium]|nr:hypothetical protein [Leptospiraceae bacterium]